MFVMNDGYGIKDGEIIFGSDDLYDLCGNKVSMNLVARKKTDTMYYALEIGGITWFDSYDRELAEKLYHTVWNNMSEYSRIFGLRDFGPK